MAEENNVSRIVTVFLLNTCGLPPRIRYCDVQAAAFCGMVANTHLLDNEEDKVIPLIAGSIAEFYVDPMFPHVGDVDVMYYSNTELAIPRGHLPPTQLPAEYHNYVQVHQIIDSHLPGYVYLQLRYLLTQRTDNGKYEYFEYDDRPWLSNKWAMKGDGKIDNRYFHGPAFLFNIEASLLLSVDAVRCVRCLPWPTQAADWPTRPRNFGWPDSATLDRVVSNGCDVVGVAHRQCRQHEWMGERQWRLSFSRAEIVLINSWMPVQQIAYHILRVYVKTQRMTESVDNSEPAIGLMSNYHIKTLMLWACELKPRSWWTENLNLVRICAELLNTLSVWLSDTRCPHYFVNNCNLLDISLSDAVITSKLMSVDETYLSTWLINNYIGRCAQMCPDNVSRLFEDVSSCVKLANAISAIVLWRVNTEQLETWRPFGIAEIFISFGVSAASLTAWSCVYWMNELSRIDKRFPLYFSAVALLHVAHKVSKHAFSDKLMHVVSTILGNNFGHLVS